MGCKSSKDAGTPAGQKPEQKPEEQKEETKQAVVEPKPQNYNKHPPPGKVKRLAVDNIPELSDAVAKEQFKKDHPVEEIFSFIEQGKIAMVKGLLKIYDIYPETLKYSMDKEVQIKNEIKINAKGFNPVLYAVVQDQKEIVRFLLEDAVYNVREAGRDPQVSEDYYDNRMVREVGLSETYALTICLQKRNIEMLKILWDYHHNAWEYIHLCALISLFELERDWPQGLEAFINSYTTDVILNSLHPTIFKPTIGQFKKLVAGTKKLEDKIVLMETTYLKNVKVEQKKVDEIFKQVILNTDDFNKSVSDLDLRKMPVRIEDGMLVTPIYTLLNSSLPEDVILKKLKKILDNGYRISQLFRVLDPNAADVEFDIASNPYSDGGRFFEICIQRKFDSILTFLGGFYFIDFWRWSHIELAIRKAQEMKNDAYLMNILKFPCSKHLFSSLSQSERLTFIHDLWDNMSEELRKVMYEKFIHADFSVYLTPNFLNMLRRDFYTNKIQNHDLVVQAIKFVNLYEFEQFNKDQDVLAQTTKFIKFVQIQDQKSKMYIAGNKVVTEFLMKQPFLKDFKPSQDLIGDESEIISEDNIILEVDEHEQIISKKHIGANLTKLKDIFNQDYISEIDLKDFYEKNTQQDLLFIDFPCQKQISIPQLNAKGEEILVYKDLTLPQLIASEDMDSGFITQVINNFELQNGRHAGSLLLTSSKKATSFESGVTRILKLLIQSQRTETLKEFIEKYSYCWTSQNMVELLEILIGVQKIETLEMVAGTSTLIHAFAHANLFMKNKINSIFESLRGKNTTAYQIYEQSGCPYILQAAKQINTKAIFDAINRDNAQEFESLTEEITGFGDVMFSQEDLNQVRAPIQDKFKQGALNMLNLAIVQGKANIVYSLLNRIEYSNCLREAVKGSFEVQDYEFKFDKESFWFDNVAFGCLVASQSKSVLNSLLTTSNFFVPSPRDFESFVQACISRKWQAGLQMFFSSPRVQLMFQSLPYKLQRQIISHVNESSIQVSAILKKPYMKHVFGHLLSFPDSFDENGSTIALECLKTLTAYDFEIMMFYENEIIMNYIKTFKCRDKVIEGHVKNILRRIQDEVL